MLNTAKLQRGQVTTPYDAEMGYNKNSPVQMDRALWFAVYFFSFFS